MAGENGDQRPASPTQPRGRVRSGIQPGGRAPAPGELALVQSFINTHYDLEVRHGADLFATPRALADWLRARGLIDGARTATSREHASALAVREALREIARHNGPGSGLRHSTGAMDSGDARNSEGAGEALYDRLAAAARGACVEVRLTSAGPRFLAAPATGPTGALGVVLAVTASAMIDGSWAALKVCPGEDCGWAFYDHSRNQTSRWCSMSVCGGRAKARAHYVRVRGQVR